MTSGFSRRMAPRTSSSGDTTAVSTPDALELSVQSNGRLDIGELMRTFKGVEGWCRSASAGERLAATTTDAVSVIRLVASNDRHRVIHDRHQRVQRIAHAAR